MIDGQGTWDSQFWILPLTLTGSWTTNLSDYIDLRVTNKAQVTGVTHASPPFTFDKSTFKNQLDLLVNTLNKLNASIAMAQAWATAISSSTLVTNVGDYINPLSLNNTWATVTSSIIDPSSITSARDQLAIDLDNAPLTLLVSNSLFPMAFRDAFLNLTCSITGTNSLTNPLSILGSPLI